MSKDLQDSIGFVFIHGAGLDNRIWRKVAEGFNHPYLLAEYPLRQGSADSRKRLSLEDYAIGMKKQIEAWGVRRIVLVAHSIGGVLALKLASELGNRLAGFIAVGAVIPKAGGSFLSAMPFPQRIIMAAIMRILGTKPPEAAIRAGLCSDLASDQASEIVRGFTPEAVRLFTDRVRASIPDVPRLYVKLTKDKEILPSLQDRMIAALAPGSVRSLDTGHLPMIGDPDGLRAILEEFKRSVP